MATKAAKALPRKLRVHVTEGDVTLSEPGNGNRCPQAEAIYRAYGDRLERVQVGKRTISFTERATGRRLTIPTPDPARAFIELVDKGAKVKELPEFELDTVVAKVREPRSTTGHRRRPATPAPAPRKGSQTKARRER